jgi:hypothetical protein
VAEDRRAIAVTHDPSWAPGFPKRIGPGGESQAALADLQGTGHLAIVFGDSDGIVHAVDGKTGDELPGWPVHTRRTRVEVSHPGVDPGHEPILASVAVGDLQGNGEQDVVATTTTGRVYAWDSSGRLLRGWPRALHEGVQPSPIPRPQEPYTREPIQGASAAPVLYDLDGDGRLEVVQGAWDGHVYAFTRHGRQLDGWPVEAKLPDDYQPSTGHFTLQDHKVVAPPSVGDLDGDGKPEVVVRSQFTDVIGPDLQPLAVSHLLAYHADGTPVDGYPLSVQALFGYYGSAQEFITEGVSIPVLADVDGDGDQEIAFAPGIFSPTFLLDGDGSTMSVYGPVPNATLDLLSGNVSLQTLLGVLDGNLPTDAPVNFTTAGAFGRFGVGQQLTFASPQSGGASVAGGLLTPGSGFAITNYETAYNARTGLPLLPGFPAKLQGLDFLGSPVIGDVTGDGRAEILNAADSSALQAFRPNGGEADGFPKFTTGWVIFAPSIGDVDSDGHNDVVALTREGFLFVWRTDGDPAGNDEWWRAGHDEHNTDQYGLDTRPPGIARHLDLSADGRTLTFDAPGGDWYEGRVDHYELSFCSRHGDAGSCGLDRRDADAGAGERQEIRVPRGTNDRITVQAVDAAGNRGATAHISVP